CHRGPRGAGLVMRAPKTPRGQTTLGVTPVGHVTALFTGLLLARGLRSSEARHRLAHVSGPAAPPTPV
ncbi:hypothetical protein ACFWIJ_16165, partial [Streptomyces sp. NPDC127079]